ncbi:uncharacterized protein [Miscanthus floridulus]|uniref:uncharacterized protein n=1 Tax=Miscanthus floridulus TaxID=154761 RepID=UPI003459BD16
MAEYEALINDLHIAIELGIRWLDVRVDSQLVIDQVMKQSSYHNTKMVAYYQEVHQLENKFDGLELNHIPMHLNEAIDALAKMTSGQEPMSTGVFTNDQYKPSVHHEELEEIGDGPPTLGLGANHPVAPSNPEVMELDEDPAIEPDPLVDWRMPYLNYLLHEALPMDKMEARWPTHHAKSIALIKGELYKRSHTRILQHCIPIE